MNVSLPVWFIESLIACSAFSLVVFSLYRLLISLKIVTRFRYLFLKIGMILILLIPFWWALIPISVESKFNFIRPNSTMLSLVPIPELSVKSPPAESAAELGDSPEPIDLIRVLILSVLSLYMVGLFVFGFRLIKSVLNARDVLQTAIRHEVKDSYCPVLITNQVVSPVSLGFFNPVILIPDGLMKKISPEQLRIILAHEGVHIERKDHFFKAIFLMLELILYFLPFKQKFAADFESEMELSCDDSLLTSGFFSPRQYGELLIFLASVQQANSGWAGIGISQSFLERRIKAMKSVPKESKWVIQSVFITLLVFSSVGLSAFAVDKPVLESKKTDLKVMLEVYPEKNAPIGGECDGCFEKKDIYSFVDGVPVKIDAGGVEAEIKLSSVNNKKDMIDIKFTKKDDIGKKVVLWTVKPTLFNRDFKQKNEQINIPNSDIKKIAIRIRNTDVPY